MNRYNIYTLVISSKFSRRRLCRIFGSQACVTKDIIENDLGYIHICKEIEIGDRKVTVLIQRPGESCIGTIIIRSASNYMLDDLERACHDGINTIRAICKDNKFIAGAGASEIELAKQIKEYGTYCIGIEKECIKSFSQAFEIIPLTLILNNGMYYERSIMELYHLHSKLSNENIGVNIEKKNFSDSKELGILDLLICKKFSLRLAINAALTILRIDHIIIARPSGVPSKIQNKGHWDNDNETW